MITNALSGRLDLLLAQHIGGVREFFDYLHQQSHKGFSPAQFNLFRANYFFRTATTIESIAKATLRALQADDFATACTLGINLFQETGEGLPARSHRTLLEQSFNIHASRIFKLPWCPVAASAESPDLLQEAQAYRRTQAALYAHDDYVVPLAASCVQETAADGMLSCIHRAMFLPYKGYYGPGEFALIEQYFTVHLGGMENSHASMARESLLRACQTGAHVDAALNGAQAFLEAQATLWRAMHIAMTAGEGAEPPTSPMP